MAEEDLSGLLNIGFGSDSEPEEVADPSTTTNGGSRSDRNALSETDFQTLKQSYQAKEENGDVCALSHLTSPRLTESPQKSRPKSPNYTINYRTRHFITSGRR